MYRQSCVCPKCGNNPSGWRSYTATSADYFLNDVKRWGSLDKDIYIDPVSREQFVPRLYQTMALLAREENILGNREKAKNLLELYHKHYPNKNFQPGDLPVQYVDIYHSIYGDEQIEKVKEVWSWMFDYHSALAKYYASFTDEKKAGVETELVRSLQAVAFLQKFASETMKDADLSKKAEEVLQRYTPADLLASK